MKTLTHSSPLGELEIPTVLGTVPASEPFDVDDDIADNLLLQEDLYQIHKKTTKAKGVGA